MARKGAEFNEHTKDRSLNISGLDDGQVHHRVSVKKCKQYGVSPDLVRAPINAQALTPDEHARIHRNNQEDLALLELLLLLQPRLFDDE